MTVDIHHAARLCEMSDAQRAVAVDLAQVAAASSGNENRYPTLPRWQPQDEPDLHIMTVVASTMAPSN